jgi:oligosaccharide repeat unit polymerase
MPTAWLGVLLAGLSLLALFCRAKQGSWAAPGALFSAYWTLAVGLPLLLAPGFNVDARAVFIILAATLAYCVGSIIATTSLGTSSGDWRLIPRRHWPDRRGINVLTWAGAFAAILATALIVKTNGLSLRRVITFDGLLTTGNQISIARYSGYAKPAAVPALLLLTYAAAAVAPFRVGKRYGRVGAFAPVGSALLYSAVSTERLCLLISAALSAGAFLVHDMLKTGQAPRLGAKRVVAILAGLGLVGLLFAGIAFVRVGRFDAAVRPVIASKLAVYAFGYLPAFSSWVDSSNQRPSLNYGTATFAGADLFTGKSRSATRAYNEFQSVGQGQTTNIYTAFRGLILDFDYSGMLLVLAIAGFVAGRAYRAVLARGSPASGAVLIASYAWIVTSNSQSVFSFSNVSLAVALAALVLVHDLRSQGSATLGRHSRLEVRDEHAGAVESLSSHFSGEASRLLPIGARP